jgi:hypothetical protein
VSDGGRGAAWAAAVRDVLPDVDAQGFAVTRTPLLSGDECHALREGWSDDERYRATVHMARVRFGEGAYRYFRHPLPPLVAALRTAAYAPLAELATSWAARVGREPPPADLDALLDRCSRAGQRKPTPLLLRYEPGGYNCLHQDLYGEVVFPLQLAISLTAPGHEHEGGQNVFVEQRPRAQSRAHVVDVPRGHAVVFASDDRPVAGARGHHRVRLRHGVATVTAGERYALGVIFHDAR